jgi:hypothetical protein
LDQLDEPVYEEILENLDQLAQLEDKGLLDLKE